MKSIISMSCILCCSLVFLSRAEAQMSRGLITIGGTGADYGNSLIQTNDAGYAIAGQTFSYGDMVNGDVYVIKLDATGNVQWTKTIGDTGMETGNCIVQATDGGYVIAGSTTSYGAGGSDAYVIKLDATGNVQWTKTIGGAGDDYGHSIILTNDGGYAIAGYTNSYGAGGNDMYVIKLDSAGNLKWTRTVGGSGSDVGNSIIQLADHGYIIVGWTTSYLSGVQDEYLVKLDSAGNSKWTVVRGLTVTGDLNSDATVINTSDNGIVVTGVGLIVTHNSYGSVEKFDTSGTLLWSFKFTFNRGIGGTSIAQSKIDKSYLMTGLIGNENVCIIKLDSNGNELWSKMMSTLTGTGTSIVTTSDSGFAITGNTTSYSHGSNDVFLLKLDSSDSTCSPYTLSGAVDSLSLNSYTTGVAGAGGSITDSNVGLTNSGGLDSLVCSSAIITMVSNIQSPSGSVSIYPDPSYGIFTISFNHAELVSASQITIEIYNMLGKKVYCTMLNQVQYDNLINLSGEPSGLYLYRVLDVNGGLIGEGKAVIEK